MLGAQVVDRHLVGDQRQEAADQTHVVIPRQPADHAVVGADMHRFGMPAQIVEQRLVRHCDPGGEARRARRILQVADVFGLRFGQLAWRAGALGEIVPAFAVAALPVGGGLGHFGDFGGIDQDFRVRALQLDRKLVDIAFLAAEGRRQGQRDRPRAHQRAAAEQCGELGAGLGDQRDAVFLANTHRHQPVRGLQRVLLHLRIGIDPFQRPAHVVEVEALGASRSVIDSLVERREVRPAAWQVAVIRRRRQYGVGHNFRRYP